MIRPHLAPRNSRAASGFIALCAMHLSIVAPAQGPESGQTPAARLEQLEETYTSNLRKYHAPIIQEYLASLEKLKQSMTQRDRNESAASVQAEIDRVRQIAAGPGLLPYDVLRAQPQEKEPDSPASPKPKEKSPKNAGAAGAFILAAASAKKISPDPSTFPEKPDGRAVPIGSAEWTTEKIPAGDYRISILYSCAGKPADVIIVARLGTKRLQQPLTAANATGGVNEFRIARLGLFRLEKELAGESLILQNSDPTGAPIWVRQVIISKATEEDKN